MFVSTLLNRSSTLLNRSWNPDFWEKLPNVCLHFVKQKLHFVKQKLESRFLGEASQCLSVNDELRRKPSTAKQYIIGPTKLIAAGQPVCHQLNTWDDWF